MITGKRDQEEGKNVRGSITGKRSRKGEQRRPTTGVEGCEIVVKCRQRMRS